MSIKAFIVDDEYQSRNLLCKMLLNTGKDIHVLGQASTIEEALYGINELHPDVVFLDVRLHDNNSFDLLRKLPKINFEIIFITAYDEYAVQAFRFNAVDYLLKPLIQHELSAAIEKVNKKLQTQHFISKEHLDNLQSAFTTSKVNDKLTIPTSDGFVILDLNEIIYCHAQSNYTLFILNFNKNYISSYTLKQYQDLLESQSFFRAHRSFLINIKHVKAYRKGEGGTIIMSNGDEIELSRQNKEAFLKIFKS